MAKLERPDITWIAANSNWGEKGISKALSGHVYADRATWQRFLSRSTLGLGVAFSLAGIFFFFAYNWDQFPPLAKLGLLEGLLVLLILGILFLRPRPLAQKALLTAASLLVGALYAVYGQVYQGGADAYGLFLLWALMILPWALVANFAPLWLLWIALVNTTLVLYARQEGPAWVESGLPTLLLCLNVALWAAFELLPKWTVSKPQPQWLVKLLALYIVALVIVFLPLHIIDDPLDRYWSLLLAAGAVLALCLGYGLRTGQIFYVSSISFAVIILTASLMLRISDEGPMILAVGLFLVGSMGLLVKTLTHLQRKWKN